jgi:phage shock protein PspC (stress-responsive transcriptional regulator)
MSDQLGAAIATGCWIVWLVFWAVVLTAIIAYAVATAWVDMKPERRRRDE